MAEFHTFPIYCTYRLSVTLLLPSGTDFIHVISNIYAFPTITSPKQSSPVKMKTSLGFFSMVTSVSGPREALLTMFPYFIPLVVLSKSSLESSSTHLPNCSRVKRLVTGNRVILSKSVSRHEIQKNTQFLNFITLIHSSPSSCVHLPEESRLRAGGDLS